MSYFPEGKGTDAWRSVAQIPSPHNIVGKLVYSCLHMMCHLVCGQRKHWLVSKKRVQYKKTESLTSGDANSEAHFCSII